MRILETGAVLVAAATSLASLTNALALPESTHAENSIKSGQKLALAICSVCHVVSPDQGAPPKLSQVQRTPSFDEIANDPKMTAKFLRSFIATTHWDEKTLPMTMPNPMLVNEETDDVVSYILSLRKHR